MPIPIESLPYHGLTVDEVNVSRMTHGTNELVSAKENKFISLIKSLLHEPMVLLLLLASTIYFITGEYGEGIFMVVAIVMVSAISLYQEARSNDALSKLKEYIKPNCKVLREGEEQEIPVNDIVIGDLIITEEGSSIPADATIIQSNDFSVSEAILTGESLPIFKSKTGEDPNLYRGTSVASGLAIGKVTAIGARTKLGLIGKSVEDIDDAKTPLQIQIASFVKKMVIMGGVIFVMVWIINYFLSHSLIQSLQESLTLAMSVLPEEIPVAFATFMALGAWRMMKFGVVVKQLSTVETLGSATTICVDKTGTITENKMSLAKLYHFNSEVVSDYDDNISDPGKELIEISMWASEPIPFDPMELAIHQAYESYCKIDLRPDYKIVFEYPLGGKPPMMTHIFKNQNGEKIIAAKGAPEALVKVCNLTDAEKASVLEMVNQFASKGFRILGVGKSFHEGNEYPEKQQDLKFEFIGLISFYDPPKENIKSVFNHFDEAGIEVKIITGDNETTTQAIAESIDFNISGCMSGADLMELSENQLRKRVKDTNLFTRMYPEAKMRIINALKANNEVVAMTGDGVNDGPALKAAHIGIAMGKRGAELAKHAASLVLKDDDLSKMVDAIALGRRIYTNLKKAIQYIISIHIPIILIVFFPLALGWIYPHIFTPVHVIMLELIMGPTCSIIYENEPIEPDTMQTPPREFTSTFFATGEIFTSILQGLMITLGCLLVYQYAVQNQHNEDLTRTMVFTTLMASNIFLTLVNRSFVFSIFTTLRYKNNLVPMIILINVLLILIMLYVPAVTEFFKFEPLGVAQLSICTVVGFLFVMWYEFVKWTNRLKASKSKNIISKR